MLIWYKMFNWQLANELKQIKQLTNGNTTCNGNGKLLITIMKQL